MPSSSSKNVAIIGAGPSGLVTIKELLEEGHAVTCFEKAPGLGGVYRYDKNGTGVYESTLLTSSTLITCFSDFPPPADAPLHSTHRQYLQYLHDYAEHFNVTKNINYDHTVKKIAQKNNQQWELTILDPSSKEKNLTFDAVAVCSGAHQEPNIPNFKGQENFTGEILHSNHYKNPQPYTGKGIVVVGAGESASDIINEISEHTSHCFASMRRGSLIIPRLFAKLPNDYYTNRLFYTLPDWLFRKKDSAEHTSSKIILLSTGLLILIILTRLLLLLSTSALGLVLFAALFFFLITISNQLIRWLYVDLKPDTLKAVNTISSQSHAGHGEQFATKSEGLAKSIAEKRCLLKPEIKKIQNDTVIFADDSHEKIDTILLCTGYSISFPFLGNDVHLSSLYKNCFYPEYNSTACFIGFARPGIGAIPPIAEMQARWFAQVLSQKCSLPSKDIMCKETETDQKWHKENFSVVTKRLPGLVNYTHYMDQLAGFIGCKPNAKKLLLSPLTLIRIYANPFSGQQYRLFGPHKKPKIAKSIMRKVKLSSIAIIYNFGLWILISVAEILYLMGMKQFKPNLRIWSSD